MLVSNVLIYDDDKINFQEQMLLYFLATNAIILLSYFIYILLNKKTPLSKIFNFNFHSSLKKPFII